MPGPSDWAMAAAQSGDGDFVLALDRRPGTSANQRNHRPLSQPAKLLAVFVVDTNETELTIPFGN
jgi:hypothetical protein